MPDDRLARIRQAFDARAADYDESAMHRDLAMTVAEGLDLEMLRVAQSELPPGLEGGRCDHTRPR